MAVFRGETRSRRVTHVWAVVLSLLSAACGGVMQGETFAIGAVNYSLGLDDVFDGFKAGMAELGYVE